MPIFVKASRRAKAHVRSSGLVKGAFVSNKPGEAQFRLDKIRGNVANRMLTAKTMKRRLQLNRLGIKLHTMRNNLYRG